MGNTITFSWSKSRIPYFSNIEYDDKKSKIMLSMLDKYFHIIAYHILYIFQSIERMILVSSCYIDNDIVSIILLKVLV